MNSFVIVVLALIAAAQANVIYKRLKLEDRIVGGEIAVPNSFPYQAHLLMTDAQGMSFQCGGSLLTTTKILTAAHCVQGFVRIDVQLGAHNIYNFEETKQIKEAIAYTIHAQYNSQTFANDIAIVTLGSPVVLNQYVTLTTLPTRADVGKTYVGQVATVSGWGIFSDAFGLPSDTLRFVSSSIVTNEDCSKDFGYIPPTQICISGKVFKAACSGDSGGPLVIGANRVQVGLVSYGRRDGCEKGFDGVYTRITEYLDWIAFNGAVEIN